MKKIFSLFVLAIPLLCPAAKNMTLQVSPDKHIYEITPKKSGNYWLVAASKSKIPVGVQHFAQLRINKGPLLTRRLLAYNRTEAPAHLERFPLQAGKPCRIYFKYDPKTTTVTTLQFIPARPYKVLKGAQNYTPKMTPPKGHPKLFVNKTFLAVLKNRIDKGDNLPVWRQVEKLARQKYNFSPDPDKEVSYEPKLLAAIQAKAFYYLVKGDKKTGREAAELILSYASRASLGNGQDICRKVGEIIYCASLVYDWCYPLLTAEEKTLLRKRMLFYAEELETSWPPFRQYASAGHGNEAQFNRDLLSMSLAIYDEDPLPYQYVAYQMFEIWLPIKLLTFKSGRHSQGTSYGQYRSQFDMIAALQFKRVFDVNILPPEIKDFPYYWYYQRLPDGTFMIEGDDNWKVSLPQYVPISQTLLNCLMALYPNPDFKMEIWRGRKKNKPMDPILFLLSNDPGLKAQDLRAKLPLTRLYKAPLPGMAVRTGWNFSPESDDLVLTMIGANYFLSNHQHGDLGSFQIYYRGHLINDLGQYRYYGIAYDRIMNKTAAVHSMMRFYDPEQKRPRGLAHWQNTGSQKFADHRDRPPLTLKSMLSDKFFFGGETPRAGFGPSAQKPLYNFMEMDLAPSYPAKVSAYTRSFVFWNQNDPNRPGTLLILDRFQTTRENIDPIFQLTSMPTPLWQNNQLIIKTLPGKKSGCVTLTPLIPARPDVRIMTAKEARTFNGVHVPARFPDRKEAKGSRIELRGKGNILLNALQVHDGTLTALPVNAVRSGDRINVQLRDKNKTYLTGFGSVNKVTEAAFSVKVSKADTHLLLLDLAPGLWQAQNGKIKKNFRVTKNEGRIYDCLSAGLWNFSPVK